VPAYTVANSLVVGGTILKTIFHRHRFATPTVLGNGNGKWSSELGTGSLVTRKEMESVVA